MLEIEEGAFGGFRREIWGHTIFEGLHRLASIAVPNSVTHIGNSAFCNCSGLTSVNVPDSVTHIGDSAFANCAGLTSVIIPDSVTNIAGSTFQGCSRLTTVTISGTLERQWEVLLGTPAAAALAAEHGLCPVCGRQMTGFLRRRCPYGHTV
ncbi:MAG: leucine-rich repeat domain-containing protein [Propionibacteriaceae bacterium]|nr:leucine-rich repeat domain-containing protein [Propionibacteriaceae bacterium]